MPTYLILLVVTLTALGSILFIIIANYKFIRRGVNNLDFKNIITQLVALTAWITILGKTLLPLNEENIIPSILIFITSLLMGAILVRNLTREVEIKEKVNSLVKRMTDNNDKLRELDKQKSEFVSLASHQLRGPLTVIQGYLSMIMEGDFGEIPEKLKDPVSKIYQSGNTLGFLINDYLNVSRIEKGEVEYVIEDVNCKKFLEDIISEFKFSAIKENVEIKIGEMPEDIILRCDTHKTKEIISNIIDNSIKYSPNGLLEINIFKKDRNCAIEFKDNGIGIEQKDLKLIFGKFHRTKAALDVNVTGTGLGLYAAKTMAEAQNGSITVESEGLGKGSKFTLILPISK